MIYAVRSLCHVKNLPPTTRILLILEAFETALIKLSEALSVADIGMPWCN